MKIRTVGSELLQADGQTDGHCVAIVAFAIVRTWQKITTPWFLLTDFHSNWSSGSCTVTTGWSGKRGAFRNSARYKVLPGAVIIRVVHLWRWGRVVAKATVIATVQTGVSNTTANGSWWPLHVSKQGEGRHRRRMYQTSLCNPSCDGKGWRRRNFRSGNWCRKRWRGANISSRNCRSTTYLVTDESDQQYPVRESRCVQQDFGLPQRCFRFSKMLRLSTDNDVKHFYAGLLEPNLAGTTILWNRGKYLPADKASLYLALSL